MPRILQHRGRLVGTVRAGIETIGNNGGIAKDRKAQGFWVSLPGVAGSAGPGVLDCLGSTEALGLSDLRIARIRPLGQSLEP
jgi:hypothetical protein